LVGWHRRYGERVSDSDAEATPIPRGAVVVGVDGSQTADRAVAWAGRFASIEDRPLVLAHALGPIVTPETSGWWYHDGGATFEWFYEKLHAEGEAVVEAATRKVAEAYPSVKISAVMELNDPRQLLLRLAEDASLVVTGSRGRGPFRSALLGSVTSTVAARAGCPVAVIPSSDDSDGEPPLQSA
jgi:nucleotide-binding universal stress UspA family protein